MIQDHVPTRELCQKLVEAGIVVESNFWWVNVNPQVNQWVCVDGDKAKSFTKKHKIPALLSSELGEMLPEQITIADETFYFLQNKEFVTYHNPNDDDADIWSEIDDTEANARAKMLLYLKEKGLL